MLNKQNRRFTFLKIYIMKHIADKTYENYIYFVELDTKPWRKIIRLDYYYIIILHIKP